MLCCAAQGNVRGLLGSLQTVLWEDSGWQPINMGDLLEPAQVGGGRCAHGCGAQQLGGGHLSAGWRKVFDCSTESAGGPGCCKCAAADRFVYVCLSRITIGAQGVDEG